MKLNFLYILFVLISGFSFCQNGWTPITLEEYSNAILDAENKIEKNTSYSYDSEYFFYTDLTIKTPELTMQSNLICNKGIELYMNQFGRLMVQNNELNVVCDSASRAIILNKPEPTYLKHKSSTDFEIILKSQCTVQKKTEGKITKYYFEFTKGAPYLAAESWLLENGQMERYILYTANEIMDDTKEEDRMIQPRMEIIFRNYQFGTKVPLDKMLHVSDFVAFDGENYILHPDYKDYELIDLRISNN